jgi:hypothetical protein
MDAGVAQLMVGVTIAGVPPPEFELEHPVRRAVAITQPAPSHFSKYKCHLA